MQPSREARVRGLIRAGELLVSGEDQAALPSYFSPDFRFHGPGGVEADGEGLQDYFALPDGNVILPTGKPFDLEFAQAIKWDGDQLIVISAFWDAAMQAKQLSLPE